MFQRIKNVISREKLKSPNTPSFLLLIKRFIQVLRNKFYDLQMQFTKDGTFQSEDALWMCSLFPQKIIDIVINETGCKTVLDVGCGTGISLQYFLHNDIEATGIENSRVAISRSPVKDKIIRHNLNQKIDLQKKFDLVWCFEVIEHIHPDYETVFLQTLTKHSDRIVLSAAQPGQGGHGHFNEQQPLYWIEKFNSLGYRYDDGLTERLKLTGEIHSENILCFAK